MGQQLKREISPSRDACAALLGERPVLMGTAGQDFGEYRQWLDSSGVDTSLVKDIAPLPGRNLAFGVRAMF